MLFESIQYLASHPVGSLAATFSLVGIVCLILTFAFAKAGFFVDRTAPTLAGGHRTEFSRSLVFAVGAILAFLFATALLLYSRTPVPGR
jgi:hypothetical protein